MPGQDTHHAAAAEELARFFQLHVALDRPIEMWSERIDRHWHDMLPGCETAEPGTSSSKAHEAYDRFCIEACGRRIIHAEGKGHGLISWTAAYEERFGKLPEIWFMNEGGVVDRPARDHYLQTGMVIASWDCSPLQPDPMERRPKDDGKDSGKTAPPKPIRDSDKDKKTSSRGG